MDQPDTELLAVKLSAMAHEIGCELTRSLLCCLRHPLLTEDSIPRDAVPFAWRGAVPQTTNCHVGVFAGRVPRGHEGFIKKIALYPRYPGAMYGAHYHLLRNAAFEETFSRVNHGVGHGVAVPMNVHIPLAENDVIGIMIQCSHTPVIFNGIAAGYVQTAFPYVIQGYTYPMRASCADLCAEEKSNILELD